MELAGHIGHTSTRTRGQSEFVLHIHLFVVKFGGNIHLLSVPGFQGRIHCYSWWNSEGKSSCSCRDFARDSSLVIGGLSKEDLLLLVQGLWERIRCCSWWDFKGESIWIQNQKYLFQTGTYDNLCPVLIGNIHVKSLGAMYLKCRNTLHHVFACYAKIIGVHDRSYS